MSSFQPPGLVNQLYVPIYSRHQICKFAFVYVHADSGNENVNVTSPCEANKPDPALTNIVIGR